MSSEGPSISPVTKCNTCSANTKRRSNSSPPKCWQDLSPKLQQGVLSFLDYHNLVNCRLVSKNLKSLVEKVAEGHKLDPNLNWNPYFTVPRNDDGDARKLLGLVRLQGASNVKKFIEEQGADEDSPKPVSNSHPPPVEASPSASKRPLTPPPPSSSPPPVTRAARHSQCLLQGQMNKPSPSPSSPSPYKVTPSSLNSTQSQTIKTTPSSSITPARPRTAPSSLIKISPSTLKQLSSPPPTKSQIVRTSIPKPNVCTSKVCQPPSPPPPTHPPPSKSPKRKPPDPSTLFPLGSVYISRCLHHDNDEGHHEKSADSSSLDIVRWTTRLVQDFGPHLTSFTFDDGKGEHSNLSFEQLTSLLSHLPNLIFLGITAGNYEHHVDYEELLVHEEEVEKLPPLPHLKIASLGYNATYHLHMDVLNAYGCQLNRFSCSKFGYFLRSPFGNHVSTNNSLQKLLEFANSIRSLYPGVLSSLEDLKVPILSSQCLMREVEQATAAGPDAPPIQWTNLKRLSLYYIHHGDGYNESCLADLWSALNIFGETLEQLCLDFQACSDFVEWITADIRPLPPSVFEPCPKVRKLSISAVSLLRSEDVARMVAAKFPNLEVLTFFNWRGYYEEAILQNNVQGKYFSGGPTPVTIPGHLGYFWKDLPQLQQASVRMDTWKDDSIYLKNRRDMLFIPKNEATYIF